MPAATVDDGSGKHGSLWTTWPAQWTSCGRLKNLENSRQNHLCCKALWLYNFSTSENGYRSETTSADLGETPGTLEEAQGASERSVARRQLRASRRTLRASGATLRNQGVVSGGLGIGQPVFRQVSWT